MSAVCAATAVSSPLRSSYGNLPVSIPAAERPKAMTSLQSDTALGPAAATGNSPYRVRLARGVADLQAAQSLRFAVFNLELREGLSGSYATGRDADPFDAVCEHLIVENLRDGGVVGTYRMQSGAQAFAGLGFYSAREFDLRGFEPQRHRIPCGCL